ncbi:MAG: hypothetical protein ABDH23_07475, partial [Endomicrobiia bacterium]
AEKEPQKETEKTKKISPTTQTPLQKTQENKEPYKSIEIPSYKLKIPKEENILTKAESQKPQEINIKSFTEKVSPKIEKSESAKAENEINIENILSKIERKIEKKTEKDLSSEKFLSQQLQTEELTIEIKKQITPEDIKKLEEEKESILKKINELKFLKSIGEITEEEYESKVIELKKALEKIKEKLE